MKTCRACLALAALGLSCIVTDPALAAPLYTPGFVNPANGNTYYLTIRRSWTSAEMDAIEAGGHLTTVNDAAENAWILSTFGAYGGQQRLLWTGLNDAAVEGQFRYVNGQTPSYTNWTPGEPNGGTSENYVAIYYPNHSSGGRWNDWNPREVDPIGLPFHGVVEVDGSLPHPRSLTRTDSSWLAIAPAGNQTGQPIGTAGAAWESTHPLWKSDLNFSTTGWAPATPGSFGIWTANATDAPAYFRKVLNLGTVPNQVMMMSLVDDDLQLYINGQLVINDASTAVSEFGPRDITSYLHAGDNLIAAKVQNMITFDGFSFMAFDTVPEPGATLAATVALMTLSSRRRQRR